MTTALKYPTSTNAVQKTLDAALLSGATSSMTLNSVVGIQNKAGVCVIDRVDANGTATPAKREYVSFTGVSGSTLTGLTRNADGGGSDQDHAVGAIVEFVSDVLQQQAIIDGLLETITTAGALDTTKVVDLTTAQTLTNKKLSDTTTTFVNASAATKVAKVSLAGATAGKTTTLTFAHTDDRAITFPDVTDTLVGKTTTDILTNKTLSTPLFTGAWDGWIAAGETWTYASADDPTFTFTIAGVDLTSKYSAGMRIKLTQTTVKYFIITAVAFSTDTTITVYGGTDYDLANAAITSPFYSTQKAPQGFPLEPTKWAVEVTDTSNAAQATPTATTWYNLGSITISIPIGCWRVGYNVAARGEDNSGDIECRVGFSTANNSIGDLDMTAITNMEATGASNTIIMTTVTREKILTLAAKTSYYLNAMTTVVNSVAINFRGDICKTIIRAVCAYL